MEFSLLYIFATGCSEPVFWITISTTAGQVILGKWTKPFFLTVAGDQKGMEMRRVKSRPAVTMEQHKGINIETLYRTQNERLKRFIQKRIWSREDAEDVLQLTYLEALRCQERFTGGSKPETWLFGIAANLTRNYFKRHYSQPQLDEIGDALLSELRGEMENDPGMLVEYETILKRTVEALETLPDDTRSMFELIVDSEYSYQDTADHMGVPIGTVRSRLSRARQTLKRHLEM